MTLTSRHQNLSRAVGDRVQEWLRDKPLKEVQEVVRATKPTASNFRRGNLGSRESMLLLAMQRYGHRFAEWVLEPVLGPMDTISVLGRLEQLDEKLRGLADDLTSTRAAIARHALDSAGDRADGASDQMPGASASAPGGFRRLSLAAAGDLGEAARELAAFGGQCHTFEAAAWAERARSGLAGAVEIDRKTGEVFHVYIGPAVPLYTAKSRADAFGRPVSVSVPKHWRDHWSLVYARTAALKGVALFEMVSPETGTRHRRLSLTVNSTERGKLLQLVSCLPAEARCA